MKCNISKGLLVVMLLSGCASLAARGLLPEVQARRPPEVDLGPTIVLVDQSITLNTSLVGTDGRVHLFATDAKKQLRHIEVLGDTVVKNEILGAVDTDDKAAIDAVEQPAGKLRVLLGERQFVRSTAESSWQVLEGNRCQRFLRMRNELFCAFVIKGEEIGAPKRTDYTVGLIFIIPWLSWSNSQAAKVVIAQQSMLQTSSDGWIIRAVVDPETLLDAEPDFMVGTDNQGVLHILYAASRGGLFFIFAAGPGGGGGVGFRPVPELRYARVALEPLVPQPGNTQDDPSSPNTAASQWLSIHGTRLFFPYRQAWQDETLERSFFEKGIRPLNRQFRINKASGEIIGLMSGIVLSPIFGEQYVHPMSGGNWLELRIRAWDWLPGYTFVAAEDLPVAGYNWSERFRSSDVLLKSDTEGNIYALLRHSEGGGFFTGSDFFIDYFVKSPNNWSAPLTLGRSGLGGGRTLAVNELGRVFAAWVNDENKFVGRWIRPRGNVVP